MYNVIDEMYFKEKLITIFVLIIVLITIFIINEFLKYIKRNYNDKINKSNKFIKYIFKNI